MLSLRDIYSTIYPNIKELNGISRIDTAFKMLQTMVDPKNIVTMTSSSGTTKTTVLLHVCLDTVPCLPKKFTIVRGFAGKYEVAMYSGSNKIIGINNIETDHKAPLPILRGEYGIKLKDKGDHWQQYVDDVISGDKYFGDFKNISNLCILTAALLGVEKFTLSDQATSGCLVDAKFGTNIYLTILRLLVGKLSLYSSIGFVHTKPDEIRLYFEKVSQMTYKELLGADAEEQYKFLHNVPLHIIVKNYLEVNPSLPVNICNFMEHLTKYINTAVYYNNSSYVRIVNTEGIQKLFSSLEH